MQHVNCLRRWPCPPICCAAVACKNCRQLLQACMKQQEGGTPCCSTSCPATTHSPAGWCTPRCAAPGFRPGSCPSWRWPCGPAAWGRRQRRRRVRRRLQEGEAQGSTRSDQWPSVEEMQRGAAHPYQQRSRTPLAQLIPGHHPYAPRPQPAWQAAAASPPHPSLPPRPNYQQQPTHTNPQAPGGQPCPAGPPWPRPAWWPWNLHVVTFRGIRQLYESEDIAAVAAAGATVSAWPCMHKGAQVQYKGRQQCSMPPVPPLPVRKSSTTHPPC